MDERRQPFMGHLAELRLRLRNSVIALLLAILVTWYFSETLYALLARPLVVAWREALPNTAPQLKFASLTEPFWVYFELSLYAAVFVASPVIFHQLWKFIAPGLYDKEKKVALPFAICSALLFIGGGAFCYFFVLPAAFKFFLSYSNENLGKIRDALGIVNANVTGSPLGVEPALFMQQYLDLATKFLLGFGLVFELPAMIFFLSYVGLVTHRKLWKFNRYWIVLSFVIGGILTPGPDVVSQFLMAMPILILYNVSILIAWVVTRKREKAAAAGL